MNWESIETKWSEMAQRVLGADGGSGALKSRSGVTARDTSDEQSVVASAVTAALATATKSDRSVA